MRVAISTGAPPHSAADAAGPGAGGTAVPGGKPVGGSQPGAGGAKPGAGGKPASASSAPGAGAPGVAVVSASGPFRILDSRGNVVVPVATGSWKIVPAAKGLQLLPPRDQAGPAGVSVLGVDPAAPLPGQPVTVRFRSNLPGVVSATAQPPGGPSAQVLAPEYQLAANSEYRLTLAAAARPGPYAVTLSADSGPGRTATATVSPTVADPAAPPGPGSGGGVAAGAAGGPVSGPEAGAIVNGLFQSLISGDRIPALARASRSAPLRPPGSSPAPRPSAGGGGGLGVLLAGMVGLAAWRLRAGALPSPAPASALAVEIPDPLD